MRTTALTLALAALLLSGCPGQTEDPVAAAPPPSPTPSTDPVADDGPAEEDPAPVDAPDSDPASDPDTGIDLAPDEPEPEEKPEKKPMNLLDMQGGEVGIDEVDPNVGTARVKDQPTTASDPGPSTSTSNPPPRKPAKRGRRAIEKTISQGEAIDYRKFLRTGQVTVVEFTADW